MGHQKGALKTEKSVKNSFQNQSRDSKQTETRRGLQTETRPSWSLGWKRTKAWRFRAASAGSAHRHLLCRFDFPHEEVRNDAETIEGPRMKMEQIKMILG
jgi:hypothetical protein